MAFLTPISIAVTGGNINVSNTSPIPVSGTFNATTDNSSVIAAIGSGNNLAVIANQLNSGISGLLGTNLTAPAAITGTTIDTITGWTTGIKVRVEPGSTTSVSNSTPSGASPYTSATTFFGQALAANPNRIMMFVQNIHTGTPLYVNLGAGAAGTGTFSFILNPSTIQGWGGASFADDHYRGAVQVSGGAWTAWEM
jgi:hypothetical protein